MEWHEAVTEEEGRLQVPSSWLFPHYYSALNFLFRIENALRIFVYLVLKDVKCEAWLETPVTGEGEDTQGTLASLARRRMSQSESFGYLGYAITCPIMHLTSGELTRLILSDDLWPSFKAHFSGKKEIIRNKLDEIGSIRNALAHFRPLSKDDVQVIRQNAQHVMLNIEDFLLQAMAQQNVVPTNTPEEWYKELRTLGTDHCSIAFHQSTDEKWLRLAMTYDCPIVETERFFEHYLAYRVLTLKASAILDHCAALCANVAYVSEYVPYRGMGEQFEPDFEKKVALVFPRRALVERWENIKTDLEDLLARISEETELIQQDHLARGSLVHTASATASCETQEGKATWSIHAEGLKTPRVETDAPEFWGDFPLYSWGNFIAETDRYPWMPVAVSEVTYRF